MDNTGPIPLLGGMKPGDAIGEFTFDRASVTQNSKGQPQLSVELTRKGSGLTVWIARKEVADNPPISTERYGISYGHPRVYGEPLPENAFATIGEAIAERVRANEASASVPNGL